MAWHRVVIKVSDRELADLDGAIETLDSRVNDYSDDWAEDEEPLCDFIAQEKVLVAIRDRIKEEVLKS